MFVSATHNAISNNNQANIKIAKNFLVDLAKADTLYDSIGYYEVKKKPGCYANGDVNAPCWFHQYATARNITASLGTKSTRLFNEFFKVDNFKKSPSFGGVFQENRLENSYYIYSFQTTNYVVLSLQYCPNDQILEWANKIVTKYSESKVIVVTHSYLGKDGKHIEPGDKTNLSNCETFWPEGKGNEGKQIWEKLIRKHSNMQFVFSGHLPGSQLISKGLNGNPVFQLSADYQDLENGGNGFMQLLKFSFDYSKLTPW
jgi:hypothetical protein